MPSVQLTTDANSGTVVEVSYPVREAKQIITTAEYDLIVTALTDRKVSAIKFLKAQYGLGLYEAKQIIDTICAGLPK